MKKSALLLLLLACDWRRAAVAVFPTSYHVEGDPKRTATFEHKDAARQRIEIGLGVAATGFPEVTDLQFPPGVSDFFIALQKGGDASWVSLAKGKQGKWFHIDVLTESEEGLLGLAFHPRFAENGRFFINYVGAHDKKDWTRVEEWRVPPGSDLSNGSVKPAFHHLVLEQVQPYQNHNAGQLAFGPDGFLYIGFGDGGFADDPHLNGQKPSTWLGKMLRVDVDHPPEGKGYAVPKDNPFIGKGDFLPEIWALGLRNPWRYAFAADGTLIVADVGQNKWEEVDVVQRGANLGWNTREGFHCFKPDTGCVTEGLVDPIWEYGHDEGLSITGGYVYSGKELPALEGKYVFADFIQGKLWAIDVGPAGTKAKDVFTLGKWPLLPSTFGRDASGELYVGDYDSGTIFKLVAKVTPAASPDAGP